MPKRGTDALSESLESQPAWTRWLVRGTNPIFVFVRYLFALQLAAGVVFLVVALVTLDGPLAARSVGQIFFGAFFLSFGNSSSGIVEQVHTAAGDFVIRGGKTKVWRERRGMSKVLAFVSGEADWAAVVRRRQDDPFGKPVYVEKLETENAAIERARDLARQSRSGTLDFGTAES